MTQFAVGFVHFSLQSPFETCEQTVFESEDVNWRTVGCQYDLLLVEVQVVEYVEECVLCVLLSGEFLYVVDDEYVDGLVERNEVVTLVLDYGIGPLHHEEVGRDVEYAQFGVEFLYLQSDGIDQVGFSAT